jgi:GR25 family glycosyltransferase involved in LPS biosynthesis
MDSPLKYFDKIYCINLDHRVDRWQDSLREFTKEGIEVERFSATYGESRTIAFNTSQKGVLEKSLVDGANNPLVLEDDVEIRSTMHLHYAMNELPEDWDIIYLGGNIIGVDVIPFRKPIRYSAHLFSVVDCWQTQSVGYSRKMVEWLVQNFKVDCGWIYDEFLRQEVLHKFKAFIVAPQITLQRKSFSDIWDRDTNFTHLFEAGNELLK